MTKLKRTKKPTIILSTWGHLGLSGLIGEWEPRSSDKHPTQKDRGSRLPAQENTRPTQEPSPENN